MRPQLSMTFDCSRRCPVRLHINSLRPLAFPLHPNTESDGVLF